MIARGASLPAEMAERISTLPTRPTERHPFGQRNGVEERAAILISHARVPEHEADALAWDLEVGGGQRALVEVTARIGLENQEAS